MAAYLLVWKPSAENPWNSIARDVAKLKRRGFLDNFGWNVRSTRKYKPGDRLYLLKAGNDHPGIMASGSVVAKKQRERKVVRFVCDALLNPHEDELLSREVLERKVPDTHWRPQPSGDCLYANADKVELLWRAHLKRIGAKSKLHSDVFLNPDEIAGGSLEAVAVEQLPAGSVRMVVVNAYERNPEARTRCLAFHKARCSACGLDFGKRYGNGFAGLIHVHHVKPLSEVGIAYKVNPVKDLLPVCPNCHAMLHWGGKTRTVNQLKKLVVR